MAPLAALSLAGGLLFGPWPGVRPTLAACSGTIVANNDSYSVNEDAGIYMPVLANDLCATDGGTFQGFTNLNQPLHGLVEISGTQLLYVPDPDYAGPDSLTYRISNSCCGTSAYATVSITVTPVNDAPWISVPGPYIAFTVAEDSGPASEAMVTGLSPGGGSDEVSQVVTVIQSNDNNSLFSVQPHVVGQYLQFTPAPNANGDADVSLWAHDNGGTANSGADTSLNPILVTLHVTPVNDAPVATADAYSTKVGATLTVAASGVLANDTDVDGPALSATISALPSHGTLALLANGSFSYHPDAGFSGTDSFKYKASDGSLSSGAATVTLTVSTTPPPATATPRPTSAPTATPAATAATESDGASASLLESSSESATASASVAPSSSALEPSGSAPPVDSGSASDGTDLMPIVIAVLIAGLLIGAGIVAAAYLLRRRAPPEAR